LFFGTIERELAMLRNLWQRGWLSLAFSLLAACGLLVAPDATIARLRMVLRDAVAPGGRALVLVRSWGDRSALAAQAALRRASADAAGTAATPPLAASSIDGEQAQRQRLELRIARLHEELESARRERARLLPVENAEPLVRARTVSARVIAIDRSAATALADRLIDAGATAGLATADLVLQAEPEDESQEPAVEPLIDQGQNSGLEPDLPVMAEGLLIGRVRTPGRLTSTVQLLTDPEFRVGARLVRDTPDGPVFGAAGIFAGSGHEGGRLDLVPNGEPVAVGDRVYTEEQVAGETVCLFIGTVRSADVPPGAAHWLIEIAPACVQVPPVVEVLKLELNPARAVTASSAGPDESSREALP
jgi:cell shape-determining protein MreC